MAKVGAGKSSNIFVWIIVLLLIVGLAGFSTGGFGGTVRTIGSVGKTEITTTRYANALQQELRTLTAQTGRSFTMSEAQAFGLDRAVLQQVVATAALENEATQLGLSVGDEAVRREVLRVPAFQGLNGTFDREAYEFALRQNGQTVAEFERMIRTDTARTLLQGAVVAGASTPEAFTDAVFLYARESRDFTYIAYRPEDLQTPLPAPTDAQLQAYYDENPAEFTLPERRKITYAWLSPSMVLDQVEVDETALRALYNDRIEEFVQPERRLVERLVFGTEEEAADAKAALDAGETDFDTLIEDRGLSASDIDLGDLDRAQLGDAGDAVFALDGPGVAGPVTTDLGPALIRVNAILAPQNVTFEEVREDLFTEFADGAARRLVSDQVDPVDDLLAGGATLEEIAAETTLELGEVLLSDDSDEPITRYLEFRTVAESVTADDFPEVGELEDGGIFALRLDEIVPPTLQPFDDVKVAVIGAWETAETTKALIAQAEAMKEAVEAGQGMFAGPVEPEAQADVLRDAFIENTPGALVTTAFDMQPGELRIVSDETGAFLLRLDAITQPMLDTPDAEAVRAGFAEQTAQGYAQDMIDAFTLAVENQAGISLNQTAINAVNAQFP
ncbi:peptidylprolyl isomerase [Oceaniglobus ichthyenteri]|uniref:peptidylprolyl isomerase n=1 Tax=Oceaniglobus ichthyenteri TaxID=2136177 RepID=UPI000D3392BE|nr:peptidylprolyl isomerase [Oceaniglobus ichthyenteri]